MSGDATIRCLVDKIFTYALGTSYTARNFFGIEEDLNLILGFHRLKKFIFKGDRKKVVSNSKVFCTECGAVISRKRKVALANQLCGGLACGDRKLSRKTGGRSPIHYTRVTVVQGGLPGHGKRR